MKTLKLTIKKKWFDMILSGEKTEEYREIKPYWTFRFYRYLRSGWYELDEDEVIGDLLTLHTDWKRHKNLKELLDFFGLERKNFDAVELRNGYSKKSPVIIIELKNIDVRAGKEEWGAKPEQNYFVLELGKILSTSNC